MRALSDSSPENGTRQRPREEWLQVAGDDDDMTRFKWSLVDTARGTRDRAPSAGFRHKHELFMATLFESVESVTGRRIDVGAAERCVHQFGGIAGVGALANATARSNSTVSFCSLDAVAPRALAAPGGSHGSPGEVLSHSVTEVLWELGDATLSGVYRLVYAGDRLAATGEAPIAFEGASQPFAVYNCVLEPSLPQCG
jgi:hypothetical protein